MEHESDGDTNCNWIYKGTGGLGNTRASGDHPKGSIIKIGSNIKNNPGELRRLAVSQTPVETRQLTLVWKTRKWENDVNNNNNNRDETINYIISECSKLAQKEYKASHDWVSKVAHWEICRKFQFDHTNKWYLHNPAPVLENDTQKLLWDFNI